VSSQSPGLLFTPMSDQLELVDQLLRAIRRLVDLQVTQATASQSQPVLSVEVRTPAELRSELDRVLFDLRRRIDQINFLYVTANQFNDDLPLAKVLDMAVDTITRLAAFSYTVILLGEQELGPYTYQEMRGVIDPWRYLGKTCNLPLWGVLARALVRRLNKDEPDYLIIRDIAREDRPKPEEFPWMETTGSLMIIPLRARNRAVGAILLGRRELDAFADQELCRQLSDISISVARAVHHSRIVAELDERVGQLAGLHLFTRSMAATHSYREAVETLLRHVVDISGKGSAFLLMNRQAALDQPSPNSPADDTPAIEIFHQSSDDLAALSPDVYRLALWSLEAGQPLFFDPESSLAFPEELYYNDSGRAVMVPLLSDETPIGVLHVVATVARRRFDESDMIVLRTIASSASIALRYTLRQHGPSGDPAS
jgi:GAF domain-containing protein